MVQEVTDNEPHTLAYHVYTDHSNPNVVYIYERSAQRTRSTAGKHSTTFTRTIPRLATTLSLLSSLLHCLNLPLISAVRAVCPCMMRCSYVTEHAWREIHEKSAPFLRLFEPSNFKRLVKDVQVKQMTEAGLGFISR